MQTFSAKAYQFISTVALSISLILVTSVEYSFSAPAALLADFQPNVTYLRETLSIDYVDGDADPCLINEKCIAGTGMRKVLRFGTKVHNIGTSDAILGVPPVNKNDSANPTYWHWDECHKHWHFSEYANYQLFIPTNVTSNNITMRRTSESQPDGFALYSPTYPNIIEIQQSSFFSDVKLSADPVGFTILEGGHKNGFCLEDAFCDEGKNLKYTCENQGVQKGCADIYDDSLACQWIDITDVPNQNGEVIVRIIINPNHFFPEINMDNNIAEVRVQLSEVPRRAQTGGGFPGAHQGGSTGWLTRGGGGRPPMPGGL
ncbi:hypothetical protein HK096_010579 [Nowakowskiella sp. JEL0078]|nr:hypothetical protein HK096_010579 [Nowakowskiella sp. JEL0078]